MSWFGRVICMFFLEGIFATGFKARADLSLAKRSTTPNTEVHGSVSSCEVMAPSSSDAEEIVRSDAKAAIAVADSCC